MKFYDISQEIFSCVVYPGDDVPQMKAVKRMSNGDAYNLTNFSMCAHNGTHIDAPFHFFEQGNTVEQIPLEKTIGYCYVAEFCGDLTSQDVVNIIAKAQKSHVGAELRILLKGDVSITEDAAQTFVNSNVQLVGVQSQTVGNDTNFVDVHKLLLGAQIVILEGLVLKNVQQGVYFLCAQPLALEGADGAPTRAILIEM